MGSVAAGDTDGSRVVKAAAMATRRIVSKGFSPAVGHGLFRRIDGNQRLLPAPGHQAALNHLVANIRADVHDGGAGAIGAGRIVALVFAALLLAA